LHIVHGKANKGIIEGRTWWTIFVRELWQSVAGNRADAVVERPITTNEEAASEKKPPLRDPLLTNRTKRQTDLQAHIKSQVPPGHSLVKIESGLGERGKQEHIWMNPDSN
jgi:hypothetical protein